MNCEVDALIVTSLLHSTCLRDPDRIPQATAAYRALLAGETRYEQIALFEAPLLNQAFYSKLDPMFEGYMAGPTIRIFARGSEAP